MRSHSFLVAAVLPVLTTPLFAQAAWSVVYPSSLPPLYLNPVVACHERLGIAIRLFGQTAAGGSPSAWLFQGNGWSPAAGPLPQNRVGAMLAFDAARDEVVLFGGRSFGGGILLDDTWRWNGAQWSLATPAARPSARSGSAMGYDHRRGVIVLFGGFLPPSGYQADTWEWNGVTWTPRSLPSAPAARQQALLAFDPVSGAMLLHGGEANPNLFSDTWSYDGTGWVERQPVTAPPPRWEARMVTDLHRQRVVMLGGYGNDPFAWEWDGAQWHASYQPSPAARVAPGLVYDAALRRVIVHAGALFVGTALYALNDTWVYRTPLPADVTPFGSGCAGTAGTPALAAAPFALPWLGDTMRNVVQTIPAGEPGAFFVSSVGSTSPTPLSSYGMPGCDLLVPTDVCEFRAAAVGRAEWALSIPNIPSLAAVSFRQQAFVLDAAANTLGLTASNAVLVTTGVR